MTFVYFRGFHYHQISKPHQFFRRISRILNFGLASFPLLVSMDQLWMMWAYKILRCSHLWQCRHLAEKPAFLVWWLYSIVWNPYEPVEMDWNWIYRFLPSDPKRSPREVTRKNLVITYMSSKIGFAGFFDFNTRGILTKAFEILIRASKLVSSKMPKLIEKFHGDNSLLSVK